MSLLAQIVAGEASTALGQQAVLNVIMNRAAQSGQSLIDVATAPKQFSAYPNALGVPSANTEAMVTAAQNGTLGNIVPNSLNYANPSLTSSGWVQSAFSTGQGVNVGGEGNVFWANSKGGSPGYAPENAFGKQNLQSQTSYSPSSSNPTGALGVNGTPYDAQGNYVGYYSSQGLGGPTGSGVGIGAGAGGIPSSTDLTAMGYSGTPADMKQDYTQDQGGASDSFQPSSGDGAGIPSSADLAAMGYSGTPADMSQDYTQDTGAGTPAPGLDPGVAGQMGVDGSGNPLPQNADAFSGSIPGGGLQQPLQDAGSTLPGPMGQIVSPHAFAGIAGMIPGPAGKIISGIAGSLPSMAGIGGGAQSSGAGLGDSSGGIPVYLTDIAAAGGSGAGPQIQKGLETAGQDISKSEQHASEGLKSDTASITNEASKDTGAITTEATGVTQYFGNLVYNVIPRVLAGAGAVVLLGLGIWMIAKDKLVPSVHIGA